MGKNNESDFERAIRETIEKQEQSRPVYNGGECRKDCNCALVAMDGDEMNFDKIKNGYPCLKPFDKSELEKKHTQVPTPLAKSIKSKRDRIKTLGKSFVGNNGSDRLVVAGKIQILEKEITEDEKLLPEERKFFITGYVKGIQSDLEGWTLEDEEEMKEYAANHFDANFTQIIE